MTVKSIIQQPKKKNYDFQSQVFFFLRKIKVKFNSQRHAFETLLLDIFTKELRDTRNACDTVFFLKKKIIWEEWWKNGRMIKKYLCFLLYVWLKGWKSEGWKMNIFSLFGWRKKWKESIDNLMWYTIIPQQLFIISLTPLKHYTYKNIGIHTQTLLCG